MIEVKLGLLGEFLIYRDGVCVQVVQHDANVGTAIRLLIAGPPTE